MYQNLSYQIVDVSYRVLTLRTFINVFFQKEENLKFINGGLFYHIPVFIYLLSNLTLGMLYHIKG